MKAYELKNGDKVKGSYYAHQFAGTVESVRFHSCRHDLLEVTVALDSPICLYSDVRDRIIVSCNVEDGGPVSGWGDNSINLIAA